MAHHMLLQCRTSQALTFCLIGGVYNPGSYQQLASFINSSPLITSSIVV
jgi:hypothetical protein